MDKIVSHLNGLDWIGWPFRSSQRSDRQSSLDRSIVHVSKVLLFSRSTIKRRSMIWSTWSPTISLPQPLSLSCRKCSAGINLTLSLPTEKEFCWQIPISLSLYRRKWSSARRNLSLSISLLTKMEFRGGNGYSPCLFLDFIDRFQTILDFD